MDFVSWAISTVSPAAVSRPPRMGAGCSFRGASSAAAMPLPRSRTTSGCEQQVKAYMVVTLVLVIASGMYEPYLAPLAAAALLVCFYLAWMWRVLPRLQRSDEKLSLRESMTSQAQAHGAGGLMGAGNRFHRLRRRRRRDAGVRSRQPDYRPRLHRVFRTLRGEDCTLARTAEPHGRPRGRVSARSQSVEIAAISARFAGIGGTACGIKPEPRKFGAA